MDLRNEILIGIGLILIILVLYSVSDFFSTNVEKADVREFIVQDLEDRHPDADLIEILDMEEKRNEDGNQYYSVKAKVVEKYSSACPIRIHYYYNYPEQNFVTQQPEYITKDCNVCKATGRCTIAFEEQAIIASHTLEGTSGVRNYVENIEGAYPVVDKDDEIWSVVWTSIFSNFEYRVELTVDGQVLIVEKRSKE